MDFQAFAKHIVWRLKRLWCAKFCQQGPVSWFTLVCPAECKNFLDGPSSHYVSHGENVMILRSLLTVCCISCDCGRFPMARLPKRILHLKNFPRVLSSTVWKSAGRMLWKPGPSTWMVIRKRCLYFYLAGTVEFKMWNLQASPEDLTSWVRAGVSLHFLSLVNISVWPHRDCSWRKLRECVLIVGAMWGHSSQGISPLQKRAHGESRAKSTSLEKISQRVD